MRVGNMAAGADAIRAAIGQFEANGAKLAVVVDRWRGERLTANEGQV